jgi:hypothetical protein
MLHIFQFDAKCMSRDREEMMVCIDPKRIDITLNGHLFVII